MRRGSLSTVCEEARCPNRTECFERKTATFLIAGDVCTRACGFCHITSGRPAPARPGRARAPRRGRERDGNPAHRRHVRRPRRPRRRRLGALGGGREGAEGGRRRAHGRGPDAGLPGSRRTRSTASRTPARTSTTTTSRRSLASTTTVRPKSAFRRSVGLLARVKARHPAMTTKSGLMLGLGEKDDEVRRRLPRAARRGCRRRHGGAVPAAVRVEPAGRRVRDAGALRGARGAGDGDGLFGRLRRSLRPLELPGGRVRAEERLILLSSRGGQGRSEA